MAYYNQIAPGQIWRHRGVKPSEESRWNIIDVSYDRNIVEMEEIDSQAYYNDYNLDQMLQNELWEPFEDRSDKCALCSASVQDDYICQECLMHL